VNDQQSFRITDRNLLLEVGFLNITERSIESEDGTTFKRVVIEHPGAVAVVPIVGDDVVLLRQYRVAVRHHVLEIPAGKLDVPGEELEAAARRELREETGFTADSLVRLTDLLTTVGFCDEKITIFVAQDVDSGMRRPEGPEEQDAEVLRIPLERAVAMVASGEIADAKTAVGLLLASRFSAAS
jgi:8-oxo-dGTP pyrophosphatase MutT (NUDIX family)